MLISFGFNHDSPGVFLFKAAKKARGAKAKKASTRSKTKDAADQEALVEVPEFDYIEVKRIVQNYVKTPILHSHFGKIPPDQFDKNINYFYFIRRYITPIGRCFH